MAATEKALEPGLETPPVDGPFRLEMETQGLLGDLRLAAMERAEPGPHEVEIEVHALGLNLREVLKALGLYPMVESPVLFGGDCSGRITRVGQEVTRLKIGDEVMGHGDSTFCSHAILPESVVMPKPSILSHQSAATIPIAFMTAHYALVHLARIEAGESVLIHAAAGGVGQAAVQVCRGRGAVIFATAGSEKKRRFLVDQGVDHVMDSRTLDFVDEINGITSGKGVDVVLNSLAGEFLVKSLRVLGRFGRFLEIGKRDIYEDRLIGLYPFRNNLSFFAIDLEQAPPEKGRDLFQLITDMVGRGELEPLPLVTFEASNYRAAFRLMRRAGHIGKIVIRLKRDRAVP